MRHRRRASAIALAACAWPAAVAAQPTTSTDAAKVAAWATGGVTADARPAAAGVPYWQAPPLPAAVIQGGTIPAGWQPQPLAFQGVGPDGRVMTQYFAPTYTFTYPVGPPVLAVPQAAGVNRRRVPAARSPQTYGAAPAPYVQGVPYPVPPPAAGGPSSMVTRYQPPPVMPPPPPVMPPPAAMPTAPPGWGPAALPPPAAPVAPPPTAAGWAGAIPAATAATVAAATPPPTAALAGVPAPADATPGLQSMTNPVTPAPASGMQPVNRPSLWRVVGVQDGDTVSCLDDLNQQRKVGLADIDAPELGQAYGRQAREALAGMVFGRTVEVSNLTVDAAGNSAARLFVGGVDVSRQMVATGNAWQDPASPDRALGAEQSQARAAQLGLWADASPTPPWTVRGTPGSP